MTISDITAGASPSGTPGKAFKDWTGDASWTQLGWRPDGQDRGQYETVHTTTEFTVTASSDVDGDGDFADYSSTASINATLNGGDTNVH